MADLTFQQLSTVQSNLQPPPPTIASAAAISPITRLTFITGTVQLVTINPFTTGYHEIVLIFTNIAPAAFATSGNIKTAAQPVQNIPVTLQYDPVSALWWPAV